MATAKKPEPAVPEDVAQPEPQPIVGSTFAERKAARLKAIQASENKAVQRSETK